MNPSDALKALYDQYEPPTRQALKTPARFVRGHGNPSARVVFIGEAPGLDEDRQGAPFVGRSGQILNGWLSEVGLRRDDIYITNIMKCHPMKNPAAPEARGNDRPPTPEEIRLCLPIVQREISIIRPKIIVTLGSPSTRTILGTKEPITQLRGRLYALPALSLFNNDPAPPDAEEIQRLSAIQVFPLFHPAALLHNPGLKSDVQRDMQALKSALK